MTRSFELKGWHVLAGLIGFFLVVLAANTVFITAALESFPGEEESKPYLQGVHFNDHIKAQKQQALLGWSASIDKAEIQGEGAVIEMSFTDKNDTPVVGLDIKGRVFRPTDDDADQALQFRPVGMGRYRFEMASAGPGVWILEGTARNSREQSFVFQSRLILK